MLLTAPSSSVAGYCCSISSKSSASRRTRKMFPEVFHIGSFFLPTYGLLVAIAFLTALWVTGRLAVKAGLQQESVLNVGIYCALAGIVGAKVLMIVLDPAIRDNWREIFSLSTLQAAGIFYGGFGVA